MKLIEKTSDLQIFCNSLKEQEFITIDLEFLRERTYFAELCLIQVGSEIECAIIDPLAPNIDLSPFFELLKDEKIVKVFHSCRQDIEILYNLTGFVPFPLFDTQIVAMVSGFGENASYESLVNNVTGASLNKSCRFSNWKKRPLENIQLEYAISDVTHLIDIYKTFKDSPHTDLLKEDFIEMANPETYLPNPKEAWKKIKHRSHHPYFLTILRELAQWRENRAIKKDMPRQTIIKDECLLNIAAICPQTMQDLEQIRNIRHDIIAGRLGEEILEVIKRAQKIDEKDYVVIEKETKNSSYCGNLLELLKLLLKIKSSDTGVVARLIANDENLKDFASFNDENNPILKGWRNKIFGKDALALRNGELKIGFDPKRKQIIFM